MKTFPLELGDALKEISIHDQLAFIHNTQEERQSTLLPFITQGLTNGDQCIYLQNEIENDVVFDWFAKQDELIVNGLASGQLLVIKRTDTSLDVSRANPAGITSYLEDLLIKANSAGYSNLRICEEIPAPENEKNYINSLLIYETAVQNFYQQHPACRISLFERNHSSPELLLKAIRVYRLIIHDGEILNNPFYIAPDQYDLPLQAERELDSLLFGLKDLKRWEGELVSTIRDLRYLVEINKVLTGTMDVDEILNEVLDNVFEYLHANGAALLMLDSKMEKFHYRLSRGFLRKYELNDTQIDLKNSLVSSLAVENKPIVISQSSSKTKLPPHLSKYDQESYQTYIVMLLTCSGTANGLLEVYLPESNSGHNNWLPYLEIIQQQLGNAIHNSLTYQHLQNRIFELTMAYDLTLARFVKAFGQDRDRINRNTQHVAEMTENLARKMGASEDDVNNVRRGVFLDAISKLSLPEKILNKSGPLNQQEWQVIHEHPQQIFKLLEDIKILRPALEIPFCHNEHWDGSGYPRGLSGKEIPLSARQFAVINVYDALMTDRPYRPHWEERDALAYIRSLAGKQFDPQVVEAFFQMIHQQSE